jgi:hypothetical protein
MIQLSVFTVDSSFLNSYFIIIILHTELPLIAFVEYELNRER